MSLAYAIAEKIKLNLKRKTIECNANYLAKTRDKEIATIEEPRMKEWSFLLRNKPQLSKLALKFIFCSCLQKLRYDKTGESHLFQQLSHEQSLMLESKYTARTLPLN